MMRNFLVAALAVAATQISVEAHAADVTIFCANGMREVVSEMQPRLERVTGQRVTVNFGEAGDLRKRMQSGEAVDVVILPRIVLDQVLSDRNIVPGTIIDLAQSSMGIGVRAAGYQFSGRVQASAPRRNINC